MILRIVIMFGLLLASIYLGLWVRQDPGYVLITIHHWAIESTFWVAAVALLVFMIVLSMVGTMVKNILYLPKHWQEWRQHLRFSRAQAKTKRGLIEFSEGHWKVAKKYLIAAAPNVDLPLVNYLTAARAAEKMGDHILRDQYLHQAQEAAPDATIAIELTQAQLQVDNQEWDEALATLNALQIITPDHPVVLQLYLKVYQTLHNWPALIAILPKMKASNTLSDTELHSIKKNAYLAMLQANLGTDDQPLPSDIKTAIQNLPKDLKHDPEITIWYSRHLVNTHQDQTAEKLIREHLKTSQDEDLITLYGHIGTDYARIPFIESLIQQAPNSAALHLCLGRLYVAKQVWGSAKTHLETSIHLHPTPQAYHDLGKLLETLDRQAEACQMYRLGLEISLVRGND